MGKLKEKDLPEGYTLIDKPEKRNIFEIRSWGEGCLLLAGAFVGIAIVVIIQALFHVSKDWAWAIMLIAIALSYTAIRIIKNQLKKKRK